jgi:hypothetical protein
MTIRETINLESIIILGRFTARAKLFPPNLEKAGLNQTVKV